MLIRVSRDLIFLNRYTTLILLSLLLASHGAFGSKPGSLSYAKKAESAMSAGDYDTAVILYEKWLEADPGDYVSWYNFACSLSKIDRPEEALEALDNAVTAGWRNYEWTRKDPDLDRVRDLPGFLSTLNRLKDLYEIELEASFSSSAPQYLEQKKLSPFVTVLPKNYSTASAPYPLVILLHGRGSDMDDMRDLAYRLALPNVVFVMPQAPYPITGGREGFEYWPQNFELTGDLPALSHARMLSTDWIRKLPGKLSGMLNVDTSKVILCGFSQGGKIALMSGLDGNPEFLGIASMSGYLPYEYQDSTRVARYASNNTSVFLSYGIRDRVFDPVLMERTRELLDNSTTDFHVVTFPCGHEMVDEMVVATAEWIMNLLRRK